jgi:hypothetical protein
MLNNIYIVISACNICRYSKHTYISWRPRAFGVQNNRHIMMSACIWCSKQQTSWCPRAFDIQNNRHNMMSACIWCSKQQTYRDDRVHLMFTTTDISWCPRAFDVHNNRHIMMSACIWYSKQQTYRDVCLHFSEATEANYETPHWRWPVAKDYNPLRPAYKAGR